MWERDHQKDMHVEERRGREEDVSLGKKEAMGELDLSSMGPFTSHMALAEGIAVFSAEKPKKRHFM